MSSLKRRVGDLEAMQPGEDMGRPFLWCWGRPLADALADAKLTLDDGPFFAIRLVPVSPIGGHLGEDPLYERDKHFLD
jgi:hypothetical protein